METKLLPNVAIRLWCLQTSIELNKQNKDINKIISDAERMGKFIGGKHLGVSIKVEEED